MACMEDIADQNLGEVLRPSDGELAVRAIEAASQLKADEVLLVNAPPDSELAVLLSLSEHTRAGRIMISTDPYDNKEIGKMKVIKPAAPPSPQGGGRRLPPSGTVIEPPVEKEPDPEPMASELNRYCERLQQEMLALETTATNLVFHAPGYLHEKIRQRLHKKPFLLARLSRVLLTTMELPYSLLLVDGMNKILALVGNATKEIFLPDISEIVPTCTAEESLSPSERMERRRTEIYKELLRVEDEERPLTDLELRVKKFMELVGWGPLVQPVTSHNEFAGLWAAHFGGLEKPAQQPQPGQWGSWTGRQVGKPVTKQAILEQLGCCKPEADCCKEGHEPIDAADIKLSTDCNYPPPTEMHMDWNGEPLHFYRHPAVPLIITTRGGELYTNRPMTDEEKKMLLEGKLQPGRKFSLADLGLDFKAELERMHQEEAAVSEATANEAPAPYVNQHETMVEKAQRIVREATTAVEQEEIRQNILKQQRLEAERAQIEASPNALLPHEIAALRGMIARQTLLR